MEQSSRLSLTWDPPYSLNIDNVDPDIEGYYVNIYVSNYTSSQELLLSEFITSTNFTFELPEGRNSGCDRFYFAIFGVNIVGEGAMKTTSYAKSTTSMLILRLNPV